MEHTESQAHQSVQEGDEQHGHGDTESIVVKVLSPNEEIANQMRKNGIDCQALPVASHPLERKPYYSHLFPMTPKLVTNKGVIVIRGKNVDLVQILQRS